MTFDQFIAKYNGSKIDFDGALGAQCVDLYRFYLKEVLGVPQTPGVIGAYQIFDTAGDGFDKIPNSPTAIPQKGDVVIWDQNYGPNGHVAIFIDGDVNRFRSFDQNNPVGSACAVKDHNYSHVTGWLRAKVSKAVQVVFFKVKNQPAIYEFVNNSWRGYLDAETFQADVSSKAVVIVELDQDQFNKLTQLSPIKK